MKHQQAEPPELQQFRKDVPAGVQAVLRKMLAKPPEGRYQTPVEVAAAVEAFLPSRKGMEKLLSPSRRVSATDRGAAKSRWRLPAVLAMLFLLGGTAFVMWHLAVGKPRNDTSVGISQPGTSPTQEGALGNLRGPLDRLNRKDIPREKMIANLPEEVVAVLGTRHEKRAATAIAFHPDGKRLAWAENGTFLVHLWDAETGKEADGFPRRSTKKSGNAEPVSQLAFTPDRKSLALVVRGKAVLWDLADPGNEQWLPQDPGPSCVLAFAPDGSRLATTNGKTITLWNMRNEKSLGTFSPPKDARSLSISPDGEILVVGGSDGVYLYSLKGTSPKLISQPMEKVWFPACFAPTKGKRLLAAQGGSSQRVFHWDLTGTQLDKDVPPKPTRFHIIGGADGFGLAYSPDGKRLAAARKNQLYVYDLETGDTYNPTLPCEYSGRVAFAPDSRHLATANSDGTVYIFRPPVKPGR